jgi:two-component system cell cycle sensor histidine kinase/response regulator CckA
MFVLKWWRCKWQYGIFIAVETARGGPGNVGQTRTPTILLVDDEKDVRSVIADMLREAGYGVLEAASGHEALAASDAHPGKIDLLLTDLIMPGMTGRMLADVLRAHRPGIVVVFISGYVDDSRSSLTEEGTHFMQKPVTAETLLEKVAEALAGAVKEL